MSLRFAGLKPRTLRSYKQALSNFFSWLEEETMPIPASTRQLDEFLAQYLEHLFLDDRPIAYAGHTLSALKRFHPRLRWKIPLAKQYFSNWKQIYVTRQAVPMPVEVLMAVAGAAAACKDWNLCLILLLGYSAFLRTSEMVGLSFNRITWSGTWTQVDLLSFSFNYPPSPMPIFNTSPLRSLLLSGNCVRGACLMRKFKCLEWRGAKKVLG